MNKYSKIALTVRRKSHWALPFALFLAAGGSITLWPTATVMSAVKQALADPLSIFADRSPGERGPGALTQTKEAYPILNDASAMPPVPEDMLMEASPLPTGEEGPKAFAAIVPPEEATAPLASLPGGPVIIGPSTGEGPTGPVLPQMPILGGTSSPPVFFTPPDEPNIPDTPGGPPVSGVPEPGTWATMVFGFLAIGSLLRRQARAGTATDRRSKTA